MHTLYVCASSSAVGKFEKQNTLKSHLSFFLSYCHHLQGSTLTGHLCPFRERFIPLKSQTHTHTRLALKPQHHSLDVHNLMSMYVCVFFFHLSRAFPDPLSERFNNLWFIHFAVISSIRWLSICMCVAILAHLCVSLC